MGTAGAISALAAVAGATIMAAVSNVGTIATPRVPEVAKAIIEVATPDKTEAGFPKAALAVRSEAAASIEAGIRAVAHPTAVVVVNMVAVGTVAADMLVVTTKFESTLVQHQQHPQWHKRGFIKWQNLSISEQPVRFRSLWQTPCLLFRARKHNLLMRR
jgi:uncharacterized protein (UPF0548 family)